MITSISSATDYPTIDGTCVRDYVHVSDLAEAHVLAISALDEHPELVLNLGSGVGYSNLQVIEAVRRVTGVDIAVRYTERRPGDPAAAVASNSRARDCLGGDSSDPILTSSLVTRGRLARAARPNQAATDDHLLVQRLVSAVSESGVVNTYAPDTRHF